MPVISYGGPTTINLIACGSFVPLQGTRSACPEYPHVNKLVSKGILFEGMPNDKRWLWREARLKDPDNNQLILYYAGENRLNPPWRIKD